ncbi:hypothetical protein HK100_010218 [Physocladia obscura]|uniref:Uncharacterized protein n=1 Tax=Physocladia obscura TaxID=109957 RepID=A0AAD5SP56_9FUNG|nr:hypothetical protein HK100_010218 [Physocladia obscura]
MASAPQQKIALVVGGSNGIGRAIAAKLTAANVVTYIAGRNLAKCQGVAQELGLGGVFEVDVASQESVHRLVRAVQERLTRVDILVLSAGANVDARSTTADGVELQFAVTHLWRFQLTAAAAAGGLLAPGARVLSVSGSSGVDLGLVDFADPMLARPNAWSFFKAQGQAHKLNDVLCIQAQRRWGADANIQFHAAYPGQVASNSDGSIEGPLLVQILNRVTSPIKLKPEASAAQLVPILLEPLGAEGGKLWSVSQFGDTVTELKVPAKVADDDYGKKCWDLSNSFINEKWK